VTLLELDGPTLASLLGPAALLRLHRLPTPDQAAVIREVLGIRRKRQSISATTLERLKAFAFERDTRNEGTSGAGTAGDII
jgi:hypothetical protein